MRAALVAVAVAVALVVTGVTAPSTARADEDDEASLLIADARDALADRELDRAAALLDRALTIDPRRLDAYVLRSSVHVARREYPAAITLLRRAHDLAPRNQAVLEALGGAEVLSGDVEAGVARLQAVVAADRGRYQAHAVLATAYQQRTRWREAVAALEAYLRTRPRSLAGGDLRYELDLANARLRAGDPAAALRAYDAIRVRSPDSVKARMGRAWATAAIDCDRALVLLRELDELALSYPEILDVRARCALVVGDSDDAVATAERFRALRPGQAAPHALVGEALAVKGDTRGALEALGKAVDLEPGNALYSMRLARVERLLGRVQTALQRLRNAGPPPGLEDEWTLEVGRSAFDSGDAAGARLALMPLVDRRGDLAPARATLGMALVALGEHDAAITHLSRVVPPAKAREREEDPRPRRALVKARNVVAARWFAGGDTVRAEAELLAATELLDDPTTWRNLGAVRLDAGNTAGAQTALDRAGGTPVARYLLGRAHGAAGKWPEAIRALELAARAPADPGFAADVAIELAYAQRMNGDGEAAVETLERALGNRDAAAAARVREAYLGTGQAVASSALADGKPAVALRILDGMRARFDAKTPEPVRVAVECDLALAASALQRRDLALKLLRPMSKKKTVCPFAAPADEVAVDVLIAWNEGTGPRARASLAHLEALRPRAGGPAAGLLALAARDISVRAAIDAFDSGKLKEARNFLDTARRYDRQSDEIGHNVAVLDIHLGHPERAVPALEALGARVPEAMVNLGIAYEAMNRPYDAMAAWERARAARIRSGTVEGWIAAKQRLWGGR